MTGIDGFYAYIESVRSNPFCWGKHDCFTFCNDAVRSYKGVGFADDWMGNYTSERGALIHSTRLLHRHGFSGIVEAVDSRLHRFSSMYPPRGSVVARSHPGVLRYAFGVVVSDRLAFVGKTGLLFVKITPEDIFWSV